MHLGVQPYGLERRATDYRFWTATPCSIWDAIEKEYCDSILLRIQVSFKEIKSNAFSLLKRVSMIAVILRAFQVLCIEILENYQTLMLKY